MHAFNAGYARLADSTTTTSAALDADISFDDPGYFEFLLDRFALDPRLGLAGTPFSEDGVEYDYRFSRPEHVSGACQLFRRECFEAIGGYVPLKAGAVDLTAVVTARMKGWITRTFTEKRCVHHRPMGTAASHRLSALFKSGFGDYSDGRASAVAIAALDLPDEPQAAIVGGLLLLAGYAWAVLGAGPQAGVRAIRRNSGAGNRCSGCANMRGGPAACSALAAQAGPHMRVVEDSGALARRPSGLREP